MNTQIEHAQSEQIRDTVKEFVREYICDMHNDIHEDLESDIVCIIADIFIASHPEPTNENFRKIADSFKVIFERDSQQK